MNILYRRHDSGKNVLGEGEMSGGNVLGEGEMSGGAGSKCLSPLCESAGGLTRQEDT